METRRSIFSLIGVGAVLGIGTARAEKPKCTGERYEIYTDAGGEWRWRLNAANGRTIAENESYSSRRACEDAVERVRTAAHVAPVTYKKDCE